MAGSESRHAVHGDRARLGRRQARRSRGRADRALPHRSRPIRWARRRRTRRRRTVRRRSAGRGVGVALLRRSGRHARAVARCWRQRTRPNGRRGLRRVSPACSPAATPAPASGSSPARGSAGRVRSLGTGTAARFTWQGEALYAVSDAAKLLGSSQADVRVAMTAGERWAGARLLDALTGTTGGTRRPTYRDHSELPTTAPGLSPSQAGRRIRTGTRDRDTGDRTARRPQRSWHHAPSGRAGSRPLPGQAGPRPRGRRRPGWSRAGARAVRRPRRDPVRDRAGAVPPPRAARP